MSCPVDQVSRPVSWDNGTMGQVRGFPEGACAREACPVLVSRGLVVLSHFCLSHVPSPNRMQMPSANSTRFALTAHFLALKYALRFVSASPSIDS